MGNEKQRQKGGASYVGGFFQFFDWNAKSRKKLFSKKSDLPEKPKEEKIKNANFPTRLILVDEDEVRHGMGMKGSSDYSCSSSVTDEDGCGTKVPGVVARLMGLESLPTHNLHDPSATPPLDSYSLDDTVFHRNNLDFNLDTYSLNSSATLPDGLDHLPIHPIHPNPSKIPKTVIKKFQTEILPPKSAKSVPITQHKIMSPIKSHTFGPRKNAANIMEAAARIIEHGSQQRKLRVKSSSVGVHDVKEKVDAPRKFSKFTAYTPQRPTESSAAKQLKGQPLAKSWNGSVDTASMRVCVDMGGTSSGQIKGKDRSISLAIQAKVNVQRREGLGSGMGRDMNESSIGEKKVEVKVTQSFDVLPSRGLPRKNVNTSSVLRQNNQKQNTVVGEKVKPKLAVTQKLRERNIMTPESSVVAPPPKNQSKCASQAKVVGTRKMNNGGSDSSDKGGVAPRGKASLRRRRSVVGENRCGEEKAIRPDSNERRERWGEDRKKGMDVVSFTFTAPMMREKRSSELSSERRNGANSASSSNGKKIHEFDMKLCSLGFNVMRGDALGVLLEQKLNELTCLPEPSSGSSGAGPSPGPGLVNGMASFGGGKDGTRQVLPDKRDHSGLFEVKVDGCFGYDSSPGAAQGSGKKHKHQEEVDDETEPPGPLGPSPVSMLDHFPAESCNSSDTIEETGQSSSVMGQEVAEMAEADLSDSAISKMAEAEYSPEWEMEYVEEIVSCVLPWGEAGADFTTGGRLFEQLEGRKGRGSDGFENGLRRKVIFGCVAECLETLWRCPRGRPEKERRVAEQVYGEICRWKGQGHCMVDELVALDMGSRHGSWLDFDEELLDIVKDVEHHLISSLLNDVILDMAQHGM